MVACNHERSNWTIIILLQNWILPHKFGLVVTLRVPHDFLVHDLLPPGPARGHRKFFLVHSDPQRPDSFAGLLPTGQSWQSTMLLLDNLIQSRSPPPVSRTSQHIQHTKQNICCSAPYPLSFQLCDVPWSTSKALDRFLASSVRVHLSSSFKHNEICVWSRFRPKVSSGGCQTKSSKCARRLLSTSFMALTLHVFIMRLTHFRCWNLEMTQVLHQKTVRVPSKVI